MSSSMQQKSGDLRYLNRRDRKILDFVARYRLASKPMIAELYFEGERQVANAARVLRRLTGRGLLFEHKVERGLVYYQLTRRGWRVLGEPPQPLTEYTEDSLPPVWAVAAYCVQHHLRRLTTEEFRELYPELWRPGLRSSSYCLVDAGETRKLNLFIVDRGGAARRVKQKVHRLLQQRKKLPAFAALIAAGRFRVTVLTGLPAQLQKIDRQVAKASFGPVEVKATLVPVLGELLTLKRN